MSTISFIIPTLNRFSAFQKLLVSLEEQTVDPNQIILVNQGVQYPDHELVKQYCVDFKSLTKARNFGIRHARGDIIGFLDDDVVLSSDYVEKVLNFFDNHPAAKGVQGVITNFKEGHAKKVGGNKFVYIVYNVFAKIFLLNNSGTKNKLLWSGRNQYASRVDGVTNCEWLSGIGIYRREVFDEFRFDETLQGYALGEDKLFSYPIFSKYSDSLFVDPKIICEHHHPDDGSAGKSKEWVVMKIQYTTYLWRMLFKKKGLVAYICFLWADIGDLLVVFISVLLRQNSWKFLWWHVCEYVRIIWSKKVI